MTKLRKLTFPKPLQTKDKTELQKAAKQVAFANNGFHIVRDTGNNSLTVIATNNNQVSFFGEAEKLTVNEFLDSNRWFIHATFDTTPFHTADEIKTPEKIEATNEAFSREGFHVVRDKINNALTFVATQRGYVYFLGITDRLRTEDFLNSGRFHVYCTLNTAAFWEQERIITGL